MGEAQPQLRLSEKETTPAKLSELVSKVRKATGIEKNGKYLMMHTEQNIGKSGRKLQDSFRRNPESYKNDLIQSETEFFNQLAADEDITFRTAARLVDSRNRFNRIRAHSDINRDFVPPGDDLSKPVNPEDKPAKIAQLEPILHDLDQRMTLLQYEEILIEDFFIAVERYTKMFADDKGLRAYIKEKSSKEKSPTLYEKLIDQEKKIEAMLLEFQSVLPQLAKIQEHNLLEYALNEDEIAKALREVPSDKQNIKVQDLVSEYPSLGKVPISLRDKTIAELKQDDDFRLIEKQIGVEDRNKLTENGDDIRIVLRSRLKKTRQSIIATGKKIAERLPKEEAWEQEVIALCSTLELPEIVEIEEEKTVQEKGKPAKKKVKRKVFTESLTIEKILHELENNEAFRKEIGEDNVEFIEEDLQKIVNQMKGVSGKSYESASLGTIRSDAYSLLVLREGIEESDDPVKILLLPDTLGGRNTEDLTLKIIAEGLPGDHLLQVAMIMCDDSIKNIPLKELAKNKEQVEILHSIRMSMYADNVEKRMRDMFRVSEPWTKADGKPGEQDTRIANSMNIDMLQAKADKAFDAIFETKDISMLDAFINDYKKGIAEEMQYLDSALDLNAITLSLLSKRQAFGPNTRANIGTRYELNKRQVAALNDTLPPALVAELNIEWDRYAISFEEYLDAVTIAVEQHNTMVIAAKERLQQMLDSIMGYLNAFLLRVNDIVWWIPEHSPISWAADLVLEPLGVNKVKVPTDAIRKAVEDMKEEFETMDDILGSLDKNMALSKGIVTSNIALLRTINREAPPRSLAGIQIDPTSVPKIDKLIAIAQADKKAGRNEWLSEELINQYEESKKQFALAENEDQKRKANDVLRTAKRNIIESYAVSNVLPRFKKIQETQVKTIKEHGIIPTMIHDTHDDLWVVRLVGGEKERDVLVRYKNGVMLWKEGQEEGRGGDEWRKSTDMNGIQEGEIPSFKSALAIVEYEHTAAEVQGLHSHILRQLEETDLPAISTHVKEAMDRLGEKVGFHARKYHEYDKMRNIGWSILLGTGHLCLNYKVAKSIIWNGGMKLGGKLIPKWKPWFNARQAKFSLWRGAKHGAKWATSPAYRMAGHLTKNPGMKIANFADDAERATKAIQAMRTNKIFAAAGREAAHLTKIEEAIIAAHKIPPTGPGGAWARTDIVAKWRILKEAKLNPTEIKFLLKNGWCGRTVDDIAAIMAKNGHALTPELKALGLTDDALKLAAETGSLEGRLAAASSRNGLKIGGKVIGAMAIGWQAYIAYERWQAYGESHEIVASKKQHLRDALMGNKEKGMPDLGFEEGKSDTEFVHKDSGIKINLKTLDSKLDAESTARFAEAMNSSAAVVVLAVSAAAGGPVGVAIAIGGIIVEITIDATIGEWEMGKKKEFLRDAPAWLLTAISVAETTGHSQFGLISNLTDNELSDLMSDVSKPEKTEIRHKLLYSILNNDLGQYAPSALGDLFADKEGAADVGFMDTFYKKDFQQFILPMFYARLGKNFGNTTDFRTEGLFKLKDIVLPGSFAGRLMGRLNEDEKTNYIARSTPLQIRQALRDAVVSYLPYLHARRTYIMRKKLADIRKEKGPDADDVITINGQKINLSEVVALMNEETTYGTKENGWKPRRIGDLTDEELANMNVPLNTLASVGRSSLYNQFVSDPIMRSKLADIYETDPSAEDFEGNSWPLAVAVNELVQHNVYNSSLFRTADERSQACKMRFAQYKTGPFGGIEALSPEEFSRQRLTEEINTYFTLHPSPSYGRKPEWEELLFPNWSVERTAPNGEVLSVDRPLVLINNNNAMYSELPHETLAKALTSLAPSQKDADFKNANLTSVVLDFDSFHMDKFMSGKEPCTVVRANFFYTDETGQSFVMQRSMYMYKNAYRTQGLAHAADYKPTNEWTYVHGKEMHYSMAEFEFVPANASMRSYVEDHMQEEVTNDVIEESTKRAEIEEYSEIRGFFQADEVAEVLYAGEKYQPLLFLSGPVDLDVVPGSPAFKLLDSLARVPTAIYEDRPTAVFVEFDYLPDGSITALATHIDSSAETSASLHHGDTGIKPIRRQAAKLRYLEGGYDLQPVVGTLNRKGLLRDADYLLRYFGGADQVLKAAFYGPKLRHQKQIEQAMMEYLSEENPSELSDEEFYALANNQALLVPNKDTTILFESRDISASRTVHKLAKSEGRFFVQPHSFDRIVIHHFNEQADREYMVSSAAALMRDSTLEPLEREQIIDWYCTPLSNDKKSLQRILNLFPEEVSVDGTGGYNEKLVAAILPKYEKAPNKKQYLIGIFEMMLDLNWVNEGNLDYLSKVTPIPMGYGALQLFSGIDPVEVNVFDYESPRLVLSETTGQFHKHTLKDGTVVTSPKRSHSRYSLTKFSTFPGTGQYDWNKVIERQESGKPIQLNASDALRNAFNEGGKNTLVHFLPRRAKLNKQLGKLSPYSNKGAFVAFGSNEYRKQVSIEGSYSRYDDVVLKEGGYPTRTEGMQINGVHSYYYGPSYVYIEKVNGEKTTTMKYLGNALQLWDKWDRKMPSDMNTEMRDQYEQELTAEERDLREDSLYIERWAIKQLTSPVYADKESAEYMKPVRRLVRLFPVATSLKQENPETPLAGAEATFARFETKIQDLYRRSKNPEAFLQALFINLEKETKGKSLSTIEQFDRITRSIEAMPDIAASIIENDLFPKVEMLLNGEGFETASNNGELTAIVTRISGLMQSVYGDPEGYLKPIFEREFHDEASGNWYALGLDADGGYKLQAKEEKA